MRSIQMQSITLLRRFSKASKLFAVCRSLSNYQSSTSETEAMADVCTDLDAKACDGGVQLAVVLHNAVHYVRQVNLRQ